MKEDKYFAPVSIRSFCKQTIIFNENGIPNLTQKFLFIDSSEIMADLRHHRSIIVKNDICPSSQ